MILKQLNLLNFRNYVQTRIQFQEGIQVLFGKNGQGKTNLLESIYYLALTKSFRTSRDQNLINARENFFRIEGELNTIQGRKNLCSIAYSPVEGKRLTFNGERVQKFADYIGVIPVVLLAPTDIEISQGGPQNRRQFLNIMLSQASPLYLHHLVQYRRALKQRNALLQSEVVDPKLLDAWDEAIVQHGVILIQKRLEAIEKIDTMVKQFYQKISGGEDKTKIVYQKSFDFKNEAELEQAFQSNLRRNRDKDIRLGSTSVGPHRDDLLFLINGKPIRIVGSQGEHKSLTIALKLAEFNYLQDIRKEPPLLLFDDIFSELDAGRIGNMLDSLSKIGQVFITTTSPHFFGKIQNWNQTTRFYEIIAGTLTERETV
ncbi:MAG: DNA replication/repair protein RecF [Calditrichia bacterium]